MLVYYFVPFIVSNRYLLFWVSNGHNSVTVQNLTHVYMNFFDQKDLGNHLLQLCPKVVKHPVYIGVYVKYPLLLSHFIKTSVLSTDYEKFSNIKFRENPSVNVELFLADEDTDMRLIVTFRNFVKVRKNWPPIRQKILLFHHYHQRY